MIKMNDRNIKTSTFSIKPDRHVRERELYSETLLEERVGSDKEALAVSDAILAAPKITASKSIHWKYIVLAIPTVAIFFLMIKVMYEPVEPIIIMDEPVASTQVAIAPTVSTAAEVQNLSALPDSVSNNVLLSNESVDTLPSSANLSVENDAEKEVVTNDIEKSAIKTDVAAVYKTPQELLDIELAKKKAKQKAKKKTEEAMQHNSIEIKPQAESQPQQSIVVLQKEPAVVAPEAKKDTMKEAVKAPVQEKSGWTKFTDSIKQGGEAPCSSAQIAMNQCS